MTINKKSLDRQAADWLREAILDGRFAPGVKLTELSLADEIGLSRSTVRTALQRLSSDGIVVQHPYSGWEIAPLSPEDATELYTLRYCLEGMAARLAAQQINAQGKQALRASLDSLRQALKSSDKRAIAEADMGVHSTITRLSGNKRLAAHCQLLNQSILIYIMSTNRTYILRDQSLAEKGPILSEHEEIIAAISAGDADLAEARAKEHIAKAQDMLIKNLTN